jgi:hypothetical protein
MPIVSEFAEEKLELEKLIKSGIFDRSPGLAQVLTYICSKYFAGETEEIKEYNIGVDALGRSPDFDQKRDSIVRVQVHRLRERLADYYKGDGAGHHTQIEIPQGQYIPSFVTRDDAAAVEESRPSNREMAEPATQVPAAPPPVSRKPFAIAGFAILVILLVATIVLILREQHSTRAATAAGQVGAGVAGDPGGVTGDSLRILVGLTDYEYTDGFGHRWLTDRYFEGGSIAPALNQRILGTRDQRIYQTPRHGLFSYHIPLKAGIYELRLHFAETQYGETNPTGIGGELTRVFGILVNGQQVMERLDVIGESGPSMADVKVFKDISPGADGILDLTFQPRNSVPFLNGIEITPGVPGKMMPIRYIAQTHGYTDGRGQYWEPDRTAIGGVLVTHPNPVANTPDPELYTGGRFGNLTYIIPVTPGRYALTVYTSEKLFGPGKYRGGGDGSHLFDILCNGVALARDFDVYKRAGGADRALAQTFHGLQPNALGKLAISLLPVKDLYPYINALEIVDETR